MPEPTERILRAYKYLSDATDHSLETLSSIDVYDPSARDLAFGNALRDSAKTLFEVIQRLSGEPDLGHIYFWPGYNSVIPPIGFSTSGPPANRRKVHRFTLRDAEGSACGVGVPRSEWGGGDLAAWSFKQLLSHEPTEKIDDRIFLPGGTHDWVSAGNFIRFGSTNDVPLQILEVGVGSNPEDQSERPGNAELGLLSIQLNPLDPEAWGQHIAQVLRSGTREQIQIAGKKLVGSEPRRWPYVPETSDAVPHSAGVSHSTESSDAPQNSYQELRERLYSIWLSTFMDTSNPGESRSNDHMYQWINDVSDLATSLQLNALATRICNVHHRLQSAESVGGYRYWYTLRIRPTVPLTSRRLAGAEELGTAMLFTQSRLDTLFFPLALPWIERIYKRLRYLEASVLLEREGREHILSDFSHELRDLRLQISDTLIPLNEVFEAPSNPVEQAWNPSAGRIIVNAEAFKAAGVSADEVVSEWLVTPDREARENMSVMLAIWGSARDTADALQIPARASTREVVLRCRDAAVRLVSAGKLWLHAQPPTSLKRAVLYEQLRMRYADECPALHWVGDEPTGWHWLAAPETTAKQNAFLRALLIALRNIFQHVSRLAEVTCSVRYTPDRLLHIKFSNTCSGVKDTKGQTEAVLDRALAPLDGGVAAFEFLLQEQQFVTEFYLRVDGVFSMEELWSSDGSFSRT